MAELFGADGSAVTKHLNNIFAIGELDEKSVSAKNALTAGDHKRHLTKFYI
jgi:hypothetical protein